MQFTEARFPKICFPDFRINKIKEFSSVGCVSLSKLLRYTPHVRNKTKTKKVGKFEQFCEIERFKMRTRRSIYKSPRVSADESKSSVAKNVVDEDDYITGESQSSVEEDNTANTQSTENDGEEKGKTESKNDEDEEGSEQSEDDVENEDESEASEEGEEMFQISTEPMDAKEASEDSDNESEDNEEEVVNDDVEKSDDEDIEANDMFQISKEPTETKDEPESDSDVQEEESKKSKKRKKMMGKDDRKYPRYNQAVEQSLEKFLFGKVTQKVKDEESSDEDSETETKQKPQWSSVQAADSDSDSSEDDSKDSKKLKAAWHDEDDDDILVKDVTESYAKAKGKHGKKEISTENYAKSLRKQFTSLMDSPQWADLTMQKEIEDSDDEFFRETTDVLAKKGSVLEKEFLEFRKLKDVNIASHNEGAIIRCAEFHPNAAIGLVAGNNGTASLFQVDGKVNAKIQSVHFENFPIKTGHFTSDGRQFLVGSQHFGHFFAYDMVKNATIKIPFKEDREQKNMQKFEVSPVDDLVAFHGKYGYIHMLSTKSRSKLFSLKMNDRLEALTFSPDGQYLYSCGVGGEVYIWDLKNQECVHKFIDDGCIKGTSISVSRNNRYIACGSDSGVVNVYQRKDCWTKHNPNPEKIVLNLTTSVTSTKFNPTSEILAMASEVKDNAVKLLHLPSMTVFKNFPSWNYNFKRPNCIDFSLNGGYLSVGNNRGAANLFRMKHYGNY